ncbi:hypothetical protein PEX2_097900 [Penicillium expansum]|uniref:Uncharacterized protein n=1 Tax=Penicillium expansum TaxID=27334 RepID=A0A0A2JPH3_PENEN|nr:hypothetical protein PEX2_097900 [Penicillium expansum]KGO56711.1 hypothetical protein PEX2_097900 [Penicillium expansum]
MDKLPPEILPLIFAEIWDLYPESLRGLNTVNRIFYDTAAHFLYETLTVRFQSNQEYEQAVANVLTLPTNANWYKHTRRLDIVCGPRGLQLSSNRKKAMGEIPIPEDYLNFGLVTKALPECDDFAIPKWELLVSLLAKIQHLVELNYAVANMFPQALLETLHQHHPACKLNIHDFQLSYLFSKKSDDACEMDLIQSPCLHGIRFTHWRESGYTRQEELAAEKIYKIMSIAPNLKHFYVDIQPPDPLDYRLSKAIAKGQGLDSSTMPFKMGELQSLSLRFRLSKEKVLQEASRHTDFSKLQSLDLDFVTDDEIPRAIASTYSFRNLRNLSIFIVISLSKEATQLMFDSINPLTYLEIKSYLNSSPIEKILMRHGPTLQGLVLLLAPGRNRPGTPMPNGGFAEQVLRYAELCPRLRNLHIETHRTVGNEDEIRLYEAYGQFPSLESLILDMECTVFPDPSNDSRLVETPEVVKTAFNLILDPALCLAIWDRIASTQKSGRLRKLELYPHSRRSLDRGAISNSLSIVTSLKRAYLVRRRIFDKQELPIIVEINVTGCLPKGPLRRPGWFEAVPQLDYAFGRDKHQFYKTWRSKWLMLPLQRLAVDLLANRRKRTREGGDGGREMKLARTTAQ